MFPKKVFKGSSPPLQTPSLRFFFKCLSIQWINASSLRCLLMTLHDLVIFFFFKRNLEYNVDSPTLLMMNLLLFEPIKQTKGRSIWVSLSNYCLYQMICVKNFLYVATTEKMSLTEHPICASLKNVWPMHLHSTLRLTFCSLAINQVNFLHSRSPHSYLKHQTPIFNWYGLNKNCRTLAPFGCKVDIHDQKQKERSWIILLSLDWYLATAQFLLILWCLTLN